MDFYRRLHQALRISLAILAASSVLIGLRGSADADSGA
jgi:hypothetical protein